MNRLRTKLITWVLLLCCMLTFAAMAEEAQEQSSAAYADVAATYVWPVYDGEEICLEVDLQTRVPTEGELKIREEQGIDEPIDTTAEAVIDVPAAGQYAIALEYSLIGDENCGADFAIDGKVPFAEVEHLKLTGGRKVLADADGNPYLFSLREGKHTVALTATQGGANVSSVCLLTVLTPAYTGEDVRTEAALNLALEESGEVTFTVPEDARYEIWLSYENTADTTLPTEMVVTIDGEVVSEEMNRVKLDSVWVDDSTKERAEGEENERVYPTDRYGNEIATTPYAKPGVLEAGIADSAARTADPLLFDLKAGEHTIGFTVNDGSINISAVTLKAPVAVPAYEHNAAEGKTCITIEAEDIVARSESSIRGAGEFSADLSPYSNDYRMINFLDGASFDEAGDMVTWKFVVPEGKAGYYKLGAYYRQSARADFPTLVDIFVDGKIPSEEACQVPFAYTTSFTHMEAETSDGKPLTIYLTEGAHELSFRINAEHLTPVYKTIDLLLKDINDLSNDIKSLMGGAAADPYRDYNMDINFPTLVADLTTWADMCHEQVDYISKYGTDGSASAFSSMTVCEDQLRRLAEEPEELPRRMSEFSTGSNSAARMLAQQLTDMAINDLSIDQIYLYQTDAELPEKAGFLESTGAGFQRFFTSFTSQDYAASSSTDTFWVDEEGQYGEKGKKYPVIQVWVGRSRQYVELMQQMADTEFFEETGIRVNLSLMPDANKLVLANAAGTAPDAVLGLQYVVPSYLNIRGALYDLATIDDLTNEDGTVTPGFGAVAQRFSSGLFIPYTLEDGIYAMPETVNFWVMFYRKDILAEFEIDVPNSMDEVKESLPELQRRSMNFYYPTAGMVGTKVFPGTLPIILQRGGTIYGDTIGKTTLEDPTSLNGFREMTELFTIYNMPTDVPSPGFYQQFRDGTLPIGIADLATYNLLLNAAPELDGLWDIALFPGLEQVDENGLPIKDENGEPVVERWTTGGAETMAILTAADERGMVDEAWRFLECGAAARPRPALVRSCRAPTALSTSGPPPTPKPLPICPCVPPTRRSSSSRWSG